MFFLTACSRCQKTYYLKARHDLCGPANSREMSGTKQPSIFEFVFVDLTKASDSIDCEALWKVLPIFACPSNFITIRRLLDYKMTATVLINGTKTEPFTVHTGMNQGCVIAPTLSIIYLCVILFFVRDRLPCGVEIDHLLDERLFSLSRLKAKTKVTTTVVMDLQYADDCAILAHTAEEPSTRLNLLT